MNFEDTIIIIKMKFEAKQLEKFRDFLIKSTPGNPAHYNLKREADKETIKKLGNKKTSRCAFFDYDVTDKITKLYWTECTVDIDRVALHCVLLLETDSDMIINNFRDCLELDLNTDFNEKAFLYYETSKTLMIQMLSIEKNVFLQDPAVVEYRPLDTERYLDDLSQKNEYCGRYYNLKQPTISRGEFQRDYDRIIYSKAFRRMVDKAQIFTSSKGDHYRTRMTHTLIVCQIARSICSALNLNQPLTEAIAMGHDLGHTPFGHQGERTLHAILTGEQGFEIQHMQINKETPFGGFKHNYQSVRVASELENSYLEIDGLDLSYQTLEGVWKHTKKKVGVELEDFADSFSVELRQELDCVSTLEGQIVVIADEIAQRSHDIDDAFSAGLILLPELQSYLELQKFKELHSKISNIEKAMNDLSHKNRLFPNDGEILSTQISSLIVQHFIEDVISNSHKAMGDYDIEEFKRDGNRVNKKIIAFSSSCERLCKYLEKIISKKVINSSEVSLFDSTGSKIVFALFRAYYDNPSLLHNGTLRRIYIAFRKKGLIEVVDFKEGQPSSIHDEWEKITTTILLEKIDDWNDDQHVIFQKRKILVKSICDFISGMTDSYAINEYRRICSFM